MLDPPTHPSPPRAPGDRPEDGQVEPQAAGGIDALALTIALSMCLVLVLAMMLATSC